MPKDFKDKDLGDLGHKFTDDKKALPVKKDDFRLMSMQMFEKEADGTKKTLIDIPISLS